MDNPKKKLTEEELKLIEETELFMQEVYSDPDVKDAKPPKDLHDKVFAEIRMRENAKRKEEFAEEFAEEWGMSEEEKELIRLGRIYRRRRGLRKYVAVAAVLVFVLAFGVTSMGGPKRVYENIKYALTGHEQITVDSDDEDIVPVTTMDEEAAYLEIEKKYGFTPVELYYLPDGVEFLDVKMGEAIQGINMSYGVGEEVKIVYFIRPNYRTGSFGKDVEDDFVEEYIEENEFTTIYIRRYVVEEKEERWSVQFEYKEVLYTISIADTFKEEVEKIVKNLFFS